MRWKLIKIVIWVIDFIFKNQMIFYEGHLSLIKFQFDFWYFIPILRVLLTLSFILGFFFLFLAYFWVKIFCFTVVKPRPTYIEHFASLSTAELRVPVTGRRSHSARIINSDGISSWLPISGDASSQLDPDGRPVYFCLEILPLLQWISIHSGCVLDSKLLAISWSWSFLLSSYFRIMPSSFLSGLRVSLMVASLPSYLSQLLSSFISL